ncbi:hypothetical protein QVD17_38827 [Tagetes erecta]|uniref:Cytochrome P450 n=1 Tax=Tagetes erecta TaxID=13708 RepID=A0AAD8JNW5_TARER|nr:hypothetical protein QVD17_38827 [Tagetes erecta]
MAQQSIHDVSWWWEMRNNSTESTMLVATIFVLILAILWCKLKRSNSSNGAPSLPPGPRSCPIIGYLPFLSSELHTQLTNMAHTYGPIFRFKLGSKLHVVINTPELAKVVVRDQDEVFSNRDQSVAGLAMTYGGQDIAMSNNNPNWRTLRKIFVHEVLSNKNLEASGSFRRDEVRKALKNIFAKTGTAIDVREIAFSTETNVLTRTIWENTLDEGVKHRNLGAELDVVASNMVRIFGRVNLSDYFPSLARFDLQGVERDMKMQRDKLDKLFTSIIEDRIESNVKRSQGEMEHEGKKYFVQILLEHRDEKDDTSLSMTQMKALLLDVMIAGTETTATTVEWAMTSLPLAEKMLMLILASLLHSFDWSLPKGEEHDLTEVFGLSLKKRKPLIAIPIQRLYDVSLYM